MAIKGRTMEEIPCPVDVDWNDPVSIRIAADWHEENGQHEWAITYRVWARETELMQLRQIQVGDIITYISGEKEVQGEVVQTGNRYWYVVRTDRPADKRAHLVFASQLV